MSGRERLAELACRSAQPPVRANRQRTEDGENPDQPGEALPQVRLQRARPWRRTEGKVPEGVDDDRDGLIVGEGLQPPVHRIERNKGRADEGQREEPDQTEGLDGLLVLDG